MPQAIGVSSDTRQATPAVAVSPNPMKLADAAAEANSDAGRAVPLWFEVSLRLGQGDAMAKGTLATHPTGLARLELHSRRGFVERHLLQGDTYTASRNGKRLRDPRPFLPPLFLLQATSGDTLRAALASCSSCSAAWSFRFERRYSRTACALVLT